MMSEERHELERITPAEAALVRPGYPPAPGYPDPYGYPDEPTGFDFRSIWRIVRKRKLLILAIVSIVTTLVTLEMFRTRTTYRAAALVEVTKDTPVIKSVDLVIQDNSDSQVPLVAMETKILLLKSRPLLEDVVVALNLDKNSNFVELRNKKPFLDALKTIARKFGVPVNDSHDPPVQDDKAFDNPEVEGSQTRSSDESKRLAPYVAALREGLSISQVRNTRALNISYTHSDPKIASMVANGLVKHFIETNFRSKTEKFTNTSDWLDRSTRELKAKVEQAETALAEHVRQNNMFSSDEGATFVTEKLSRLHDQASRAEMDRILKQSLYEEVRAGRVAQLPEAFSDPKTGELQRRLGELAVTAAQLDVKYGAENPRVREVRQQMEAIERQINAGKTGLEERLRADYERALREERALKGALAVAKNEAVDQNQATIQYNILKQQVETAKSLYTDFLQKTNQAKVQLAEQENNVRLIEPAPALGVKVGPNRLQSILIGLLASLVAAIGLAFFLEYLDTTIRTVEDVNRFAQLPALGVIPALAARSRKQLAAKNGKRKALPANGNHNNLGSQAVMLDNRSSAAEAYRTLRTSVLLSSAGGPPKTILVTSAQPGEGKSTTVVNTAISLAQLGSSVLIIDCDLRRPTVHKMFEVDMARGLSTYLSRDVELDGLIQKLQIQNLSFLPCGPIPPNPAELISSDKMKQMLADLAGRYDHILIDSPPLVNVTDPVILSTMVDGVIMVVHGGRSSRDMVRRARQELTSVGAKIFGVVLNNVDLRREGYDDYYYYNRYYGYGDDQTVSR